MAATTFAILKNPWVVPGWRRHLLTNASGYAILMNITSSASCAAPLMLSERALVTTRGARMETVYLPLQWAPNSLNQPILPGWSFNLFNVNVGASSNASVEQQALQTVGSYGKQIGHLAEALELIIGKLQLLESNALTEEEKDTLRVFLGDVSAIRKIKAAAGAAP